MYNLINYLKSEKICPNVCRIACFCHWGADYVGAHGVLVLITTCVKSASSGVPKAVSVRARGAISVVD